MALGIPPGQRGLIDDALGVATCELFSRVQSVWSQSGPKLPVEELGVLLDPNFWQQVHSWSLWQVTVRRQLAGGVHDQQRCCTCVLYRARPGRHVAWPKPQLQA